MKFALAFSNTGPFSNPDKAIAMAQAIYDESVEYEDGTPNNASQIAKDVSEFLHWASYPEMDERKVLGIKTMLVTSVLLGFSIWWKRFKWSYIKSRQIVFNLFPNFSSVLKWFAQFG